MNEQQFKHWLLKTQPNRKYAENTQGQTVPIVDKESDKTNTCLQHLFRHLLKFYGAPLCSIDHLLDCHVKNTQNTQNINIPLRCMLFTDKNPKNYIAFKIKEHVYGVFKFYFPILLRSSNDLEIIFENSITNKEYCYEFRIFDAKSCELKNVHFTHFSTKLTNKFINYVLFSSSLIDLCILSIKMNMSKFLDLKCLNRDIHNRMKMFNYTLKN